MAHSGSVCYRSMLSIWVICTAALNLFAQGSRAEIEKDIDELVRDSERSGTGAAFVRLVKVGKPALGPLIERLKTTKYCDFQYEAARVIWRIDPKHEILNPLLFETASGNCEYRYSPEKYLPHVNQGGVIAQFFAAQSLAEYQEGGIALAAQLPERNRIPAFFYAYPAIEKVLAKYESGELPTDPAVIGALKRGIPNLALGLDVEKPRNNCDVWHILTFFKSMKNKELSAAAEAALRGKTKVGCAPVPQNTYRPGTRPRP